MLTLGVRAVPWPLVVSAVLLAGLLMEVVGRWPYATWALEPAAVGLTAAAAAWAIDEPLAVVVDTSPRHLWWRTCARLPAVGLVASSWVVAVGRTWSDLGDRGGAVLLQGAAAITVAVAWATWRRSRGAAAPGTGIAITAIAVPMALAVTPDARHLPLLPHLGGDAADWAWASRAWTVVGVAALLATAGVLADGRYWRLRWRPGRSPAGSRPARTGARRGDAWS